ncbi:hypothetical protein Tco_0163176 [Tanacetum coccineum]
MAPRGRPTRLNPGTTPPPVTDPTTTTSVTSAQLQAMIDEGVTAVLAARATTRNGDDSHTSGTGVRRNERTVSGELFLEELTNRKDAKGKSVRSEDLEALICMVTKCTVFKIISVYQLILNQRELEHEATPLDRTRPPHLEQKSWNLYGWEPLCSMAWSWLYCYGTMYGLCDHARVHKIEYSIHQSKDTRANIRDNGFVGTPEDTSMDIVGHYNDGFCSQSSKSSHVTKWLQALSVRQKSYADLKGVSRWSLRLRDKVMLKVYPGKGFVSFGQRRELNPRFVGPFKVIKRVGDVAYQDRVPEECARVLNTFQCLFKEVFHAVEP